MEKRWARLGREAGRRMYKEPRGKEMRRAKMTWGVV